MDSAIAIPVIRPSSRPSSTLYEYPSGLPNTHPSSSSTLRVSKNLAFIAPPPPPPLLLGRSDTHSRPRSPAESVTNVFPVNNQLNPSVNRPRSTAQTASSVPLVIPPPPPILIPNSNRLSTKPTFNPSESALRLSLSPPGPLSLHPAPNAISRLSAYADDETQTTIQTSQGHHLRNSAALRVSTYEWMNIESRHQSHKHVVPLTNSANAPLSLFSVSRPLANASPFPISPRHTTGHTLTYSVGSEPSHSPHSPHSSSPYPTPTRPSTGTASNNMLLAHTTSPFERGPFPASSVPSKHLLQLTPSRPPKPPPTPHQLTPPPPPRPPKPPELEADYTPNPTTPSPPLPERLHHWEQSPPLPTGGGQDVPIIMAVSARKIYIGTMQSPTPPTSGATGTTTGGHETEDVNASFPNGNESGAKVSGHSSVSQANRSIQGNMERGSRHLGSEHTTGTPGPRDQPDLAAESTAPGTVQRERGERTAVGNPDSEEGSRIHSTAISAFGAERTGRVYSVGDDGVEVINDEACQDMDDMRSDSGMTMDNYDPNAFDFPRRVNDEMVHVLNSAMHENSTTTTPTAALSPEGVDSNSQGMTVEVEGELPPTYDEVELEAWLQARSSSTLISTRPFQPSGGANTSGVVSPTAPRLVPAATPPSHTFSPPPAFRPKTPKTPPTPDGLTATPMQHTSTCRAAYPSQRQHQPTNSLKGDLHSHPRSSENRPTTPPRPVPSSAAHDDSDRTRGNSISESSSGHGYDGLMMASRSNAPGPSRPTIYTSPPTPSPVHSPSNSVTRSHLEAHRLSLSRQQATGDEDSPGSQSPSSQSGEPFRDPPSFQTDTSPFAQNPDAGLDSPQQSTPTEAHSQSRLSDITQFGGGTFGRSTSWQVRSRSSSGFWSNVSSTVPLTPRSDGRLSHESGRRLVAEEASPANSDPHSTMVNKAESTKAKHRITIGGEGSRMSSFFRSSSWGATPSHGGNAHATGASGKGFNASPVPKPGRTGGVDLLDDGLAGPMWQEDSGWNLNPNAGLASPTSTNPGSSPGGGTETEQSILTDLWEGIEYGFCAPGWNKPPAPGPYSDPAEWPKEIDLYPVGSKPFFIRAPTWRSLLRFLASQSALRIEPSVEALAMSRTPTMDLRLVVQFARTPYTPHRTSRDVCLYMMLHAEMPAATTRSGRAIPANDRAAMEGWDTRVLPYGFVCAEGSLLAKRGGAVSRAEESPSSSPGIVGTPAKEQEPDGEDSMFVTIPPPFIELPVKMSDVAMYLHECLVLSRKNAKVPDRSKAGHSDNGGGLAPSSGKLRRGHGGSSPHLPADGTGPDGSQGTANGVHMSISSSFTQPDVQATSSGHHHYPSLIEVPGIKRLAKAVKTFYPEEYAIGSLKANEEAERAAVEGDPSSKGEIMSVSNTTRKGKLSSSGRGVGGAGAGIFFGAFNRAKRKSSAGARHSVGGFNGVVSGGRTAGRDMNAERFELVTPWRE